jgi:hypothetical protein
MRPGTANSSRKNTNPTRNQITAALLKLCMSKLLRYYHKK